MFIILLFALSQQLNEKTIKNMERALPSVLPISIRLAKMKKEGDVKCGANNCPDIGKNISNYHPDSEDTYQCGETCTATTGTFEYTFVGEKFGIYGVYSTNSGTISIILDGTKVDDINLNRNSNERYSLIYVSEDLTYHEHTVKIEGQNNKQYELYKLIFWPSLKAKRLNITEFTRTGDWEVESDLIGGVRSYSTQGGKDEIAVAQVHYSRVWVYGTKCSWHGKLDLNLNDFQVELDEHDPNLNNDEKRIDSALLYESPELAPGNEIKFTLKNTATLNYVYYIEENAPAPTPPIIPISIRSTKMKKGTDIQCTTNNCPNINENISNYQPESKSTYQCGETCTATTGTFEYSFTGEKFGLFGIYSKGNDKIDILIDGKKATEIDLGKQFTIQYPMIYLSKDLAYGKHTVNIRGQNNKQYQLYKLIFWPSLKAKRLNITEFTKTGDWKVETDEIGGVRWYSQKEGVDEIAVAPLNYSRVWVYSTICQWHGKLDMNMNDFQVELDEYDPSLTDNEKRIESALLYESPELAPGNEIKFTLKKTATLNFIYYIEEKSNEPSPTPSVLPISIRSAKMKKGSDIQCTNNDCPNINKDINNYQPESKLTYQCGETCTATTGTFEYSFIGEKFGVYAQYSTNNGKVEILIDGRKTTEVDLGKQYTIKYSLIYLSEDLTYKEHKITIRGQNNKQYQLYKLIFWPSLKAKRLNITEFTRTGDWLVESDKIGGVRWYSTKEGNNDEIAIAQVHYSRVWIYGTICQWHGKFDANLNDFQVELDENDPNLNNDEKRIDSALLYESPELAPGNEIKFTLKNTATLNYVYYIEENAPSPTPSIIPISIRSINMKKGSDIQCTTNNCPNINNNINNYQPESKSTYQCGETCTATTGTFEYSFTGEKFGVYAQYSTNNGKVEILIDDTKTSEVDLGKQYTIKYSLIYLSEDLTYKEHKITIRGQNNKQYQLYKLIFWPSLKAKRLNITEFTRTGDWIPESDLIGGVRLYTKADTTDEVATAQLRYSKLWIYGTVCKWHGRFDVTYGDLQVELNENDPQYANDDSRLDSYLLFETPEIQSKDSTIKFTIRETVTLNYIYYIEELPQPTPSVLPISIRLAKMKKEGDVKCGANNCPNLDRNISNYHPDSEDTYQCGETCTATTGTFEYTFVGEKFGIYGVYSTNSGTISIILDGTKVDDINLNRNSNERYSLIYVSEDLTYHEHTIKIEGQNNKQYELYKLIFWPSLKAKRLNITEFDKTGRWIPESDLIGGVRLYTEIDSTDEVATTQLRFSKLWIYGTVCKWHGRFDVTYGDLQVELNENDPQYANDDSRLDSYLLFETPEQAPNDYTFKISIKESITLKYVYYVEDLPPTPTPSVVPVSVSFDNMNKEGKIISYSNKECPTTNLDSPKAYNCGKRVITTSGTFNYAFYGVKFGIIGAYSPNNGKFTLEIDSQKIEINTNKEKYEENTLIYLSDNLQYKEHHIKVQGIGEKYQLYKLIFWPSLNAKRLNITEFKLEGDWTRESDLLGGVRAYTSQGGVNETAVANIHCSHIWVYGTKCSWHGNLLLDVGDIIHEVINERVDDPWPRRYDSALLYESPDFNTNEDTTVKFTIMDTATLYSIYYIEVPSPNPTPSSVPISIPLDQMNPDGDILCYKNACSDDYNSHLNSQCGSKCIIKSGTYNYSFTGIKFAIIGARGSNYDSFNLIIDDSSNPIEINANYPTTDEFSILYLSEDLSYKEHLIKIQSKTNEIFKLYKLIYWPSLLAKRMNITDFALDGNWTIESDLIGGSRAYTTPGGVNETAVANVRFSHIWIYGTKCGWHGKLLLDIDDLIHEEINEKISGSKRYDSVLLYESPNMNYEKHSVSFVITETATLYYIYYLDLPPPSSTPTPSYTPEPTPLLLIMNETDCTNGTNKRCFYENNEQLRYNIQIIVSNFTNLDDKQNNGGSAIHLINTGFICSLTTFTSCNSITNFGGAVYLENNYEYEVNYDLENLTFVDCKAKCGGAVYLYAVSERSKVNIKYCVFEGNTALASKNDEFYGGSAIFLTCINANLLSNSFNKNKGAGGAFKIYQVFKDKDSNSLLLSTIDKSIFISNCLFEILNESDCSLFYYGARKDVKVELKDSIFNGILNHNSHHINGFITSKDATKLTVKNCFFNDDYLKSINIIKNNDYISINIRNQVFKYNEKINNKKNISNEWMFASILMIAALLVAGLVFTLKKRNLNEFDNNEVPLSLVDSNE